MIRVVLDTNVVVSAHLNDEGYERHVVDLVLAGKVRLYVSRAILEEYEGVLRRPKFALDSRMVRKSVRLICSVSREVKPQRELNVTRDAADSKFLECAQGTRADYVVTGNKRHFPQSWRQTFIVNAREFVEGIAPELRR